MQYGSLASVYDALVYDMPYAKWAEYLSRELCGCDTLLELGCGTGNMTRYLARSFDCTAVDLSDEMLAVAAEKLRREGLPAHLVQGDMRSFTVHRPVDGAVACCDGFNYLLSEKDVLQTLNNLHGQIKTGGKLIFDVSTAAKLSAMDGQLYSEDTDDITYIWRNTWEASSSLLTMDIAFFAACGQNTYRRFDETHVQRGHTVEELTGWLKEAGYEVLSVTDDYSPRPVGQSTLRAAFTARVL